MSIIRSVASPHAPRRSHTWHMLLTNDVVFILISGNDLDIKVSCRFTVFILILTCAPDMRRFPERHQDALLAAGIIHQFRGKFLSEAVAQFTAARILGASELSLNDEFQNVTHQKMVHIESFITMRRATDARAGVLG